MQINEIQELWKVVKYQEECQEARDPEDDTLDPFVCVYVCVIIGHLNHLQLNSLQSQQFW